MPATTGRVGRDTGNNPAGPVRERYWTKSGGATAMKEGMSRGRGHRQIHLFEEDFTSRHRYVLSTKITSNVSNAGTAILPGSNTNTAIGYFIIPRDGVLVEAQIVAEDTLAANDTNYQTFALTNTLRSGAGTTAMLAATDANTTKATGGSALTAQVARTLTLHGTAANLRVAKGDVILFLATATQSPTVSDSPTVQLTIATLPPSVTPISVITTATSLPNLVDVNSGVANGEAICTLSATNDAIATGWYLNDNVVIPATRSAIFEAWVKVGTVTTAQGLIIGLASAYNNTWDSIAKHAWFRLVASMAVVLEADDGTTDTDDQATSPATTLTADTYYFFQIDMTDTSEIVFLIDGTPVGTIAASAFAASDVLQPIVALQKASGTGAISVYTDSCFVTTERY